MKTVVILSRLLLLGVPILLWSQNLTTPIQENLLARHAPDVFLRTRLLVKTTPKGEILVLKGNTPISIDSFFVLVNRRQELKQFHYWQSQQKHWLRRGRRQQTIGAACLASTLFLSFRYPPQKSVYNLGFEVSLAGWGLLSFFRGHMALQTAHRFAARWRERFGLQLMQQWANQYNLELYRKISSQPIKRFK